MIGTGEHIHDLEVFRPSSFINKMLGMGDLSGLLESISTSAVDKEGLMRNIAKGVFTFRDMKGQFEMISGLGPMSKIMGMIPGMPQMGDASTLDQQGGAKLNNYSALMRSMTNFELDSSAELFWREPSRVYRIARGAGVTVQEVEELLHQHKTMSGMVKGLGGPNGIFGQMQQMQAGGGMPNFANLMGNLPGGMGGMMQNIMNNPGMGEMMQNLMNGGGGNPFASLMGQFGGGQPPRQ